MIHLQIQPHLQTYQLTGLCTRLRGRTFSGPLTLPPEAGLN